MSSAEATLRAALLAGLAALAAAGPVAASAGAAGTGAPERPQARAATRLAPEAAAAARALLQDLGQALEGVETLRASFVQTRTSPLLAEPLVSRGTLHLRREPGTIVLEFDSPQRAVVRSDATSYQTWYVERKLAERFEFESNELTKAMLRCFSPSVSDAEKVFEIVDYRESSGHFELTLEPRDEALRPIVGRLVLGVRREDKTPVSLLQVAQNGEEVRLDLTAVERNPGLEDPAAVFDAKLPKDVRLATRKIEGRTSRPVRPDGR
jgi:outer membrane lipoprotein-sorting protein